MEAKLRCSTCGVEAPPGARFCPACGASLNTARPRMATGLLPAQHVVAKRYAIIRKIAQGGQSAVYLAHDTYHNNAERAIKEMSESQIEPDKRQQAINDFIRESQMLQSLNYPALAKVYDLFIDENNKYYLVMEFVPGHNLEDELVLYRRAALDWEDVTRWGMTLADTLTYLHSRTPPIIYRDLKPANVMLLPDGSVKLIDFGIARWLHPMRMNDTMQLGTDGYAPLEQYSSRSEPRSDIYALGASLYHLLTGRVPEPAPMRMAGHNMKSIREYNPRTPEVVEQVIFKAMNLQPQDRYRDAARMREALEAARLQSRSRTAGMAGERPGSGHSSGSIDRLTGAPIVSPHGARTTPHSRSSESLATPYTTPGPVGVRRSGAPGQPPRLSVRPVRMDAGYILVNQVVTSEIAISNRGGGALTGHVETNFAALTVEPKRFDETVTTLKAKINAHGLVVGPYVCHIAVRSNGGDQIVQVRFVVRPADERTADRGHATGW